MGIVQNLHQQTSELYSLLKSKQENRDDLIKRINALLEERQQTLQLFRPPFTEDEKRLAEEILIYDKKINVLLSDIMGEIKRDIVALKVKKQKHSRYENPYNLSPQDGMFLDKKN
ncbi:flagellar protein FliT [Cytobacillus firmus]|uniref:Flagellar protein FliT n=1 Tax=Cytobacillus firmus DS1 TaxID=1307436 RepID=W7L8C0_CYTFI|nr:flagellar protein FliT [Cytobacillus firmus]EWG11507.1 FliT [Cytobacillus firmus DS1]